MVATLSLPIAQSEPPREPVPRCLYCHAENLAPRWSDIHDRLGYAPGAWGFDRCQDCGSLRLTPMPAEGDLADFYPPVYSFSHDMAQPSTLRGLLIRLEFHVFYGPQYRAQTRAVLRGTQWHGRPGVKMLDIGCGRGLRLATFQRHGFDVHGLDLQPEVIEYLNHQLNIPGTVGGVEALSSAFEPQSLDLITAFYLLEHVPDVSAVLERCHRLLRPGGWFVGVVPVCDGLQARLFGRRWLHVTEAPRHLSLPSRKGLHRAANLAGYNSVHIRPDSLLNCAGIVGGSLFPGSDMTNAYGRSRLSALAKRFLGGACAIASLPFCWAENYLLDQTSHALIFCRRA
jgi:SAM-dependent methyltransferase